MIQALRYEPRGQRQRFEPPEQQQQDRHIHLHFHLHFTFRAHQGRSAYLNVRWVKSMLVALVAATVIPLWLFPWVFFPVDGFPPPAWERLLVVSFVSMVVGLALAWCAVGTLFYQAWRANPRERLGMALPFALLLLIVLLTAAYQWLGNPGPPPLFLTLLGPLPFIGVLFAHPLLTALLLGRISREAQALSQQAPTYRKLGFVAVAGMVLMLLGGVLLNLSFMLSGGNTQWPFLPAILFAAIVAIGTSIRLFRLRRRMEAHPKDPSPADIDSWQEPQGY